MDLSDRVVAAIRRKAERDAAGIDIGAECTRHRKRGRHGRIDLWLNGSLGVSPEERRGRQRERNGRLWRESRAAPAHDD